MHRFYGSDTGTYHAEIASPWIVNWIGVSSEQNPSIITVTAKRTQGEMPQVVMASTVSSGAMHAAEKAQAAGRANRELAFEDMLKPGPLELVGKRTSLSANCPFLQLCGLGVCPVSVTEP